MGRDGDALVPVPAGVVEVTEAVLRFFDGFLSSFPVACGPGCSTCCTTNIFATTGEAALVARALGEQGLEALRGGLGGRPLYRPTTTTNEIARACLERRVVEDRGEHQEGRCPLLDADGLCTVYGARPLACRGMHSLRMCEAGGEGADADPFLMELQLVFYQLLEHLALEYGGACGNLFDLLGHGTDGPGRSVLLTPQPFPGMVVMPSNRGRIAAALRRLLRKLETEMGIESNSKGLIRGLVDVVGDHVGLGEQG